MAILDKSQLLTTNSLKIEVHHIEALGGEVRLRELSTNQRLKVDEYNQKKQTRNTVAHMLSCAMVDEEDNSIMTMQEAFQFMAVNGQVVEDISEIIMELSGLNQDALDDAEKN